MNAGQQLNRDEIRELFFKEGLIRFDEQVCRQFSLEKDFDNRKYAAFLRASRIPRRLKREDVLRNLHLLADDGVRNAGVLLFAKDPAKFFLQAVVVCAVFQGKGKAKIIDKRTVGGTLVECYTGTMAYFREHLNTEYVIRGGPREEILELPEEALREAILNALAHRDYRLTGAIQVHIFYDRVEMLNPGSLVPGLRIEDLGHVSLPRNPLLFGLMDRMELVENVGSGIKRIRDAMNEYGLRPPVIRPAETWFSLTFRRKGPDEAVGSLSRKGIGEPARFTNRFIKRFTDHPRADHHADRGEPSNHQRCHRLKFGDYEEGCPQADSQAQGRGFAPPHRFATRRLLGG